jgi:hypothetical protein
MCDHGGTRGRQRAQPVVLIIMTWPSIGLVDKDLSLFWTLEPSDRKLVPTHVENPFSSLERKSDMLHDCVSECYFTYLDFSIRGMQVARPLLVSVFEFHHALNVFCKQVLTLIHNALQKPVRLHGVRDVINISVSLPRHTRKYKSLKKRQHGGHWRGYYW